MRSRTEPDALRAQLNTKFALRRRPNENSPGQGGLCMILSVTLSRNPHLLLPIPYTFPPAPSPSRVPSLRHWPQHCNFAGIGAHSRNAQHHVLRAALPLATPPVHRWVPSLSFAGTHQVHIRASPCPNHSSLKRQTLELFLTPPTRNTIVLQMQSAVANVGEVMDHGHMPVRELFIRSTVTQPLHHGVVQLHHACGLHLFELRSRRQAIVLRLWHQIPAGRESASVREFRRSRAAAVAQARC